MNQFFFIFIFSLFIGSTLCMNETQISEDSSDMQPSSHDNSLTHSVQQQLYPNSPIEKLKRNHLQTKALLALYNQEGPKPQSPRLKKQNQN